MSIQTKFENILNANEQYIVHQCNCVTKKSKGLSKQIFDKYPQSNIYHKRQGPDEPGTIIVKERIINILGQFYPGRSKGIYDTKEKRLIWFQEALDKIALINDIHSIAIPYRIGCGLAGGNWKEYLDKLKNFAENHPGINVTMYRLK